MINPLTAENITAESLRDYVMSVNATLSQDYNERISGIDVSVGEGKKIAGYENLRRFFDGDHWSYIKDDGLQNRVYNYCRTTVMNYTSFLASEPPEDDVPARDNTDDIEVARANEVEKLLLAIKEDNNYPTLFSEAVQNQSLLGDCFIFGPYVEWKIEGGKRTPRIRFNNIKRPENARIIWSTADYAEMEGFILNYRVSVNKAEQIYQKQMEERNISSLNNSQPTQHQQETATPMTTIQIYWDDKHMLAMVDDKVLDFVKHDWGFVPGIYTKNMSHPTRPWGVSDIEDMLDPQVEYNEAVVATRGKINQTSTPHIFYSGEGEPMEYKAGQAQMIKLGQDDRLWPDPMGTSTAPYDQYIASRKRDIHSLSMISEIFYGGSGSQKSTGRALSVLMQGVNNKVKMKQQYWKVSLKMLNANILRLVEIYVPHSKDLIQGYYKTDTFFPSILIRNITEEINKFNMKLQSQYTTMKNVGIPDPKEEKKIMKKEWEDPSLMLEIARNPQLRMQMQQMMAQQMQQASAGQGQGQGPSQEPQLTEGDGGAGRTSGEALPMAAGGVPQQSPISQSGSVSQRGFRGQ